jgi:hypothetical protein
MKSLRTLVSVAVLGTIIALSGCGGGKGNSEPVSDKQLGLLSKTWKVAGGGSVLKAGADSTVYWTDFKITISGTKGQSTFSYTCTGRPPLSVWPVSGTFQFGSDPTKVIARNDQAQITYSVDPSSSHLQMKFSFTGTGYSRVSNVSGDWIFNLVP